MEIKDDCFRGDSERCNLVSMNADNNPIDTPAKKPEKNEKKKRGSRSSGGRHN